MKCAFVSPVSFHMNGKVLVLNEAKHREGIWVSGGKTPLPSRYAPRDKMGWWPKSRSGSFAEEKITCSSPRMEPQFLGSSS